MTVEVKSIGPCRKELGIRTDWEAVSADYEGVVGAFVRESAVPGFRKGKAPRNLVEKRYGSAIADETRDSVISRLYRQAMSQEQLSAVAVVAVNDVRFAKGEGVSMRVTVDVPPEFKLPKYRGIPVKGVRIHVTDEAVEKAYQRFLDRMSRFEDVAGRPVRKGDLVLLDHAGTCEGKPLRDLSAECRDLGDGRDVWVLADEPEYLPGFAAGLTGMQAGERRTLSVNFPADYHVQSVAGRSASYEVTVKQIREKHPPEVNEAFLKMVGAESVDAMKARFRQELERAAKERDLGSRRDQVARHLLVETHFDVPQSVVEQELQMTVRAMVQRIVAQGGTREQIAEHRSSIMDAASRTSTDRVKLGYVLARIAEEEKVAVGPEEVNQRIEMLAQRHGMPAADLRREIEKNNGLEGVEAEIREEKAMAMLVESAKVTEETEERPA
jgi:trigger factor